MKKVNEKESKEQKAHKKRVGGTNNVSSPQLLYKHLSFWLVFVQVHRKVQQPSGWTPLVNIDNQQDWRVCVNGRQETWRTTQQ